MNKNQSRGNIVFFVGVLVFAIAFIVGWLTDVSAVIIDLVMGLGLIVEFTGICICYKKDKNEEESEKVTEEVKALEEEKVKTLEEKTDDVIEVEEPKKKVTAKKKATNKKGSSKKSTSKKTTNKKSNTSKKGSTVKKKTTKKNNTKKTTK